jgi:HSP20 family protein
MHMSTLIRYEPLVGQLDGLFNDFFRPAYATAQRDEPAPIRFDVRETAEAYVVSAELPGVKKEDISVEIEGSEVTLSAESRRETNAGQNGEKWLRTERYFGKAARRFALPQEVDEAKAVAKYDNGLLELTLPKKTAVTGRKLSIQ